MYVSNCLFHNRGAELPLSRHWSNFPFHFAVWLHSFSFWLHSHSFSFCCLTSSFPKLPSEFFCRWRRAGVAGIVRSLPAATVEAFHVLLCKDDGSLDGGGVQSAACQLVMTATEKSWWALALMILTGQLNKLPRMLCISLTASSYYSRNVGSGQIVWTDFFVRVVPSPFSS